MWVEGEKNVNAVEGLKKDCLDATAQGIYVPWLIKSDS